ncbi:ADP-ribosyl cyclase/cyclic ADP-ribose hydrolase 1-like isoform X2 [Alosa alosa]|uniref:ADP-ribosyl cyclase/cyclic ADP-ribose hydrolase 1-like isoform X2 n=1 Tax=Alosa alosa TaxID=278164 RepID=UPI0020154BF4|nr:ADP-ribosyl cyclase/cyclic ADP-ribose hydrolase 1-like isoform X2 [Alosa alosa]
MHRAHLKTLFANGLSPRSSVLGPPARAPEIFQSSTSSRMSHLQPEEARPRRESELCNHWSKLPRYDCEGIWREFEEAVVRRTPCSVRVKDYQRMFRATPQTLPCDKLLFWSKTHDLVHSYSAVTRRFWTLEDTLVGYMFNDLIWCGKEEKDRGFNFSACPEWSDCVNHPVYSLWKQASQNFAEAACGNITVILNGSIKDAFNRKSMFGGVELDSLNPRMVNHVNIKVVTNLEGPLIESCTEGSIVDLIKILQTRGFRWTCTDYDLTLMILQCMKNPKQYSCLTCADSLLNRKKPVL